MRIFAQKPKATPQATSAKSTIPRRAHFGQSPEVSAILHSQRTIGNQAVQRLFRAKAEEHSADPATTASPHFGYDLSRIPAYPNSRAKLQPKLTVSTPGDIYEQEADRVADQVMCMPEPQIQRTRAYGGGRPGCTNVREGNKALQVQRLQASGTSEVEAPPIVDEALRSPGQPLDAETQAFMERRFGYNFSQVRVHADARSAQTAKAVNARAFTVGKEVLFGAGQYQPRTQGGRTLLAHELAHVVQQNRNKSYSTPVLKIQKVGARAVQRRPADVVNNGYHSFYISAMLPGRGTEVRVQFYQDPSNPRSATFAVWYEETRTMHRVSFTPSGPIQPRILDERRGVVTFDLDNDVAADVVLTVRPNESTRGVDFSASFDGSPFFSMSARPQRKMPRIVPGRGIPMGTLPNRRTYYLMPFTSHLPGGPRYVDDRGHGVNPALEFQAAATLRAAAQGYLIGMAVLLGTAVAYAAVGTAVGAGAIAAAEATAATVGRQALIAALRQAGVRFTQSAIVGITRTVVGRIVWLETGTATAGLTHIMQRHGSQFAVWGLRSSQAVGQFLVNTVRTLTPVATQSGGAFDFVVRVGGAERMVRIVIGSNGFIVTAHPL